MKQIIRPDIFKYDDDISFLRDHIEYLRKRDKKFTLRQLARNAELAVGYLPMCLSKKRNLSLNALDKIIDHLKLAADEKKHLRLFRQIALTESTEARIEHLHSMQKLKSYRDNNAPEVEVFKYLTSWLNVAILELARSPEFKPDSAWIQNRLSFPSTILDIERAMNVLKSIGYIEEMTNGQWLVKEKLLNCNDGIFKISLGEFHRQILNLVAQAIETQPRSERLILGHTMALSEQGAARAREVLNEAQQKLEKIGTEQKNTDRVCHYELCGITVAKHSTGVKL